MLRGDGGAAFAYVSWCMLRIFDRAYVSQRKYVMEGRERDKYAW